MKKTIAAGAISASLLLSGCVPVGLGAPAASSQLSTADTCKEFNALGAMIGDPASMPKDQVAAVPGKFRDLAAKAADSLKDDINMTADYVQAALDHKTDPDLATKWEAASQRIQAVCNTVH